MSMKGEVRSPETVWLLVPLSCHLYGYYWWLTAGTELKEYLEDEDLNPMLDIVIALATCGLTIFFWLPLKYGKLMQRARIKAGDASAEDRGVTFLMTMLLCYYGYAKMQEELNEIWKLAPDDAPAGAPAELTGAA
jgi:hypothetical protein